MCFIIYCRHTDMHLDSFRIEYIRQELLNKIKEKSMTQNILWIKDDESVMCGFYSIAFIEYILIAKT